MRTGRSACATKTGSKPLRYHDGLCQRRRRVRQRILAWLLITSVGTFGKKWRSIEGSSCSKRRLPLRRSSFSGAVTRVAPTDTAFVLRHPGYEVDIVCRWSTAAEKESGVRWVTGLRDKLRPFAHGVYANQLGETSEDLVRGAYGANYARLAEIKKQYDPNNVLRLNQNIKPA
jgi:hypothetical protein